MDAGSIYFFLFLLSVLGNVALALRLHRAALRIAALEARESVPATTPGERLAELEDAVRTLAAQVDQVASGQDFLNRIVAERLGKLSLPPSRPAAPPEITPH
jgi:hypothetical protein